jgi:hypothetical protein
MNGTPVKRASTAAKIGSAGAAGAVLVACAACCAPLVAPLLAWLGLSTLGMATTGWYLETAVLSAIALAGFLLVRRHKAINRSRSCEVDGRCGCNGNVKSECLQAVNASTKDSCRASKKNRNPTIQERHRIGLAGRADIPAQNTQNTQNTQRRQDERTSSINKEGGAMDGFLRRARFDAGLQPAILFPFQIRARRPGRQSEPHHAGENTKGKQADQAG